MSRIDIIDPTTLPAMQVLEAIDTDAIIQARMARFVALWRDRDPPAGAVYDVDGLEFDPIKINQELNAYFELLIRDRVNQAARDVTLAFATGGDLDAIASRYPGGVPRLEGESDSRYRRRIWLSPNTLSPHGTAEAYMFWALTSSPNLRDASAAKGRPRTGEVNITILNDDPNQPVPSREQILAAYSYIQSEAREGMTDVINVSGPRVKKIRYVVDLWRFPGVPSATMLSTVRASLEKLIENLRWLGADHTLMLIEAALAQPGVYNTLIREPAGDVLVNPDGFVQVTDIILADKGTGE